RREELCARRPGGRGGVTAFARAPRPLTARRPAFTLEPICFLLAGGPMSDGSATLTWLDRLRTRDPRAAQALGERLLPRLLALARSQLGAAPRRAADEEDVVVQAFAAFLRAVQEGRLPRLDDRDNLWAVLFTFVQREALDQRRRALRQKRGGGAV